MRARPVENVSVTKLGVFHQSSKSLRILWWVLAPFVAVHIVLATISGYRAIWQIYRVDLSASSNVLAPGTTITWGYVSSARVPSDAELQLVQGAIKQSLSVAELPANHIPSYDPRSRTASVTVRLTPEQLSKFARGPALLRVTAYGNMQWLRTPPPKVREAVVSIP